MFTILVTLMMIFNSIILSPARLAIWTFYSKSEQQVNHLRYRHSNRTNYTETIVKPLKVH